VGDERGEQLPEGADGGWFVAVAAFQHEVSRSSAVVQPLRDMLGKRGSVWWRVQDVPPQWQRIKISPRVTRVIRA
jgi:hypothetical protein